ncbi:MAG: VOC family protein [Patescibacteria group bacterium]
MNAGKPKETTVVHEFRFILLVRNLEAQRAFYETIFDWPIIEDWGGGILYDTGGTVLELIQDSNAEKPNASNRISIMVSDVWSLYEDLKDKVKVIHSLKDNSWGDTSFRISDPDGFLITIFTHTKDRPKG